MTIDETINHAIELAEEQEAKAISIGNQLVGSAIRQYRDELSECAEHNRHLAAWLTDLKEAKRFLQLAITDFEKAGSCSTCARQSEVCDFGNCKYIWQYKDEVEKLIRGI